MGLVVCISAILMMLFLRTMHMKCMPGRKIESYIHLGALITTHLFTQHICIECLLCAKNFLDMVYTTINKNPPSGNSYSTCVMDLLSIYFSVQVRKSDTCMSVVRNIS